MTGMARKVESTLQYSTLHYSTVQYSTVQYSTVHYITVQYSTVQYSTLQYSTVQYSRYLGPDDRDGEEGGEYPDGDHHPPTVAQRAEGAGVVRVHDHHKPEQYSTV